jgi:hypothetical protein
LIWQWEKLAQPVQVLAKSRGQEHVKSENLAYKVRSLCIDLVNEHDLIDQGRRITTMLAGVFAELPEVAERLAADAETLANRSEQRDDGQRKAEECEVSERLFKLGCKPSIGKATTPAFGGSIDSEKPLDEVILEYLVDKAREC